MICITCLFFPYLITCAPATPTSTRKVDCSNENRKLASFEKCHESEKINNHHGHHPVHHHGHYPGHHSGDGLSPVSGLRTDTGPLVILGAVISYFLMFSCLNFVHFVNKRVRQQHEYQQLWRKASDTSLRTSSRLKIYFSNIIGTTWKFFKVAINNYYFLNENAYF